MIFIKNKRRIEKAEFIFAFSLLYKNFLRLPLYFMPQLQTILMIFINIFFLFFLFDTNLRNRSKINIDNKTIFLTVLILLNFAFDAAFRSNTLIASYFKYFIFDGFIPVLLMKNVKNVKAVIKYGAYMSCVLFIGLFWTPFNKYLFFSDYMDFGFNFALYIFIFTFMYKKIFKSNKMFLIELLIIFEIVFFANKGSILVVLMIIFIYNFFFSKKTIKFFLKYSFLLLITLIVIFYIQDILNSLYSFLLKNNLNSYSLKTLIAVLDNSSDGLSGRNFIWDNAKYYYRLSPLFGNGIGSFNSYYGYYTHNIFLEILTSFGVIGMIFFVILMLKEILTTIFSNDEMLKKIYVVLVILSIIPLCFSMYMVIWTPFWLMLYFNQNKIFLIKDSEKNE